MDYSQLIRNRISDLCEQRGFSYNMLAKRCGLNQSTVDNIMRGLTKNPGILTLQRIALGFNMTVAELLDFDELNSFSFDD